MDLLMLYAVSCATCCSARHSQRADRRRAAAASQRETLLHTAYTLIRLARRLLLPSESHYRSSKPHLHAHAMIGIAVVALSEAASKEASIAFEHSRAQDVLKIVLR